MKKRPKLKTLKPRLTVAPMQLQSLTTVSPDSWRGEKTSAQRGYGYKWQQARERFLALHPLCCMCEREGHITPATVVDHKIPHRGDMELFWRENNWQPLCAPHHNVDKAREERGLAPRVRYSTDSWPE